MQSLNSRHKSLATREKLIIENGIYHIIQRAPGKEVLFLEDNDYLRFLSLLKEVTKRFKIDVFCFALLTNHLHILLRIKEKNLKTAMKFLFQSYAQYFNNKYGRKGHVFCGRYKAILCDNDSYLLTLSFYIHLNPFKAGLSTDIFNYRWFSLDLYIKSVRSSFLNAEFILSLLDDNIINAKSLYKELLRGASEIEFENIIKSPSATKNFFNNFFRSVTSPVSLTHFKNRKEVSSWMRLEEKIKKFKNKSRIRKPSERQALAYLIIQLLSTGYTINEISQRIGFHRTTIYRLMQHNCP